MHGGLRLGGAVLFAAALVGVGYLAAPHRQHVAAAAAGGHGQPVTVRAAQGAAAASWTVAVGGNDSTCTPCGSINGAYQRAAAGDVVQVNAGTYPYQKIDPRPDLRNLSPGCTPATPSQCVRFLLSGVKVNGQVEVFGSDLWLDGGSDRANPGLDVTGLIDTSTTCATCSPTSTYPDHVVISGTHSASIGIHSTNTMTWQHLDVGPATVTNAPACTVKEGPGAEIIVGPAGVGPFFVPTNVTVDDMVLHDQNGDASARAGSEPCHWGGLFLDSVNGLLVENSVFARNVIYNVEVQNFFGPASTNVTFRNDSFGCTVDWLSTGASCLGQSSIQADGTFTNFLLDTLAFGEPTPGFACYRAPCDFSTWKIVNNTGEPLNRTPPPLPSGGVTTTTTTPTTTATVPTTTPTQCSPGVGGFAVTATRTNSTITLTWTAPAGAVGYQFLRDCQIVSTTNDGTRTSVKFSLRTGSVYTVRPVAKLSEGSVKG